MSDTITLFRPVSGKSDENVLTIQTHRDGKQRQWNENKETAVVVAVVFLLFIEKSSKNRKDKK